MARGVLARLVRANPTAVFLCTTILVVAALIVGGWFGTIVLLTLAGGIAALLVTAWPNLDRRGRIIRAVILLALLTVALV